MGYSMGLFWGGKGYRVWIWTSEVDFGVDLGSDEFGDGLERSRILSEDKYCNGGRFYVFLRHISQGMVHRAGETSC